MVTNLNRSRSTASSKALALRCLIRDTNFTIVSNNCWGSHIYRALDIQYQSPFVGLFLLPKCYLNLLRCFDYFVRADLSFVRESRAASVNAWREREHLDYPIGLLDGQVEIHFQHYTGKEEARSKWQRRCQRITPDPTRWFFKFDDRQGATAEDISSFCSLPFANKVCFTRNPQVLSTIIVPGDPGEPHVADGVELSRISHRYFNTLRWLSTRSSRVPLPSLL